MTVFERLVQMSLQQRGQVSNVMSFKYGRGPVVTILVSKTAGRYRVQSDSFEAMWLIVQVTVHLSNVVAPYLVSV